MRKECRRHVDLETFHLSIFGQVITTSVPTRAENDKLSRRVFWIGQRLINRIVKECGPMTDERGKA